MSTTFKSITLAKTKADLAGTWLEAVHDGREYLPVRMPEEFFYQDTEFLRLYPEFLPIDETADGSLCLGSLHSAADKAVITAQNYYALPTEDATVRFREAVATFKRAALRHLVWRLGDVLNARDSANTSSGFFVGVPYVVPDALVRDGRICDLDQFEIAMSARAAKKLGVANNLVVQLGRFPETKALAAKVRIVDDLTDHVIGMPLGCMMLLAGGDLDGDTYYVRNYFTESCRNTLIRVYSEQATLYGTQYQIKPELLSWKDERDPLLDDEGHFDSKGHQKIDIGPITNDGLAACVIKLDHNDTLPISFEQARVNNLERPIEETMDTKKGLVHSDGTPHNPMLLRNVLGGSALAGDNVAEVMEKLREQGYDVDVIKSWVSFLGNRTLRKTAYENPAFSLLCRRDPVDAEAFLRGLSNRTNVAEQFINRLFGRTDIRAGKVPAKHEIRRSAGRYGLKIFNAVMADGEIQVACGLGRYTHTTTDGGRAIQISEHGTEVAMFRRTVEVVLDPELITKLDSAHATRVKAVRRTEGDDAADRLATNAGRVEVTLGDQPDSTQCYCLFHRTWADLLNALARSYAFSHDVGSIIREPDRDTASAMLKDLVRRMIRRMYKTYQVKDGDLRSWSTIAGANRINAVCLEDPTKIEDMELTVVERTWRKAAAQFLRGRGLINAYCDTITGDAGTSFHISKGANYNFVTESDPLKGFIPDIRRPVSNAIGNLQDFTGAEPESFVTSAKYTPPMREGWVVAVPYDFKDALGMTGEFLSNFTVKMPKVVGGLDFGSYEYYQGQPGMKCQTRSDVKGVVFVTKPIGIEFADGTRVTSDMVISLCSQSHEMLRHTQFTMALTAAAKRMVDTQGGRMRVPDNVNAERVVHVAKASGLYENDTLTCRIFDPETGEYISIAGYDRLPAGRMAIGVHAQVPEIVCSSHGRETVTDRFPTTVRSGGVVSGMAGAFCMLANDMTSCVGELHRTVNPVIAREVDALANAVQWSGKAFVAKNPSIQPVFTEPIEAEVVYD